MLTAPERNLHGQDRPKDRTTNYIAEFIDVDVV